MAGGMNPQQESTTSMQQESAIQDKNIVFLASIDTIAMPVFLKSLFVILLLESPDTIGWCEEGLFFEIRDSFLLERQVLPLYFKHNKLSSFVRQLNNFGFKRKRSTCSFIYGQVHFAQRNPEEMLLINRQQRWNKSEQQKDWEKQRACDEHVDGDVESNRHILDINDLSAFYNELSSKFLYHPNDTMEEEVLQLLLLDPEELPKKQKCKKKIFQLSPD